MVKDKGYEEAMRRIKSFSKATVNMDDDSDASSSDDDFGRGKKKGKGIALKKAAPKKAPAPSADDHAPAASAAQEGGASKRKAYDIDSDDDDEEKIAREAAAIMAGAQDKMSLEIDELMRQVQKNKEDIAKAPDLDMSLDAAEVRRTQSRSPSKQGSPLKRGRAAVGGCQGGAAASASLAQSSSVVDELEGSSGRRFLFTVKMKDVREGKAMRIAEGEPMSRIFEAFCKREGFDPESVKFKWDGETVKGERLARSLDPDEEPEKNQLDAVGTGPGRVPRCVAPGASAADEVPSGRRFLFTVRMKDVPDGKPMRIAENDTMSKIFDAFCKRNDLDAGSVKFKWDGETIKREALAKSLDPDEEPEINQLDALGPACVPARPDATAASAARSTEKFVFSVKMKGIPDGKSFRIGNNDPMSKVFDAFCKKHALVAGNVKFKWDGAVVQRGTLSKSLDPDPEPDVNQLDAY